MKKPFFTRKDLGNFKKISVLSSILLISLVPLSVYAVSISFDFPSSPADGNISNSADTSQTPQITSSGNDVYLVFQDGTKIMFSSSTNGGTTIGTTKQIGDSNSGLGNIGKPQLAISGNNVYTAWRDFDSNSIKFNADNNKGQTFGPSTVVSLSSGTGTTLNIDVQIASTGDNVYAVWHDQFGTADENRILFRASTDNGNNFNSIVQLDADSNSRPASNVAAWGDKVYVIWKNSDKVRVASSTNNGGIFAQQDIGDGKSSDTTPMDIVTSGDNVYAAWDDGTKIKFSHSSNSGSSFSVPVTLGNGPSNDDSPPQLANVGNNVYAVWQDRSDGDGDIKFRSSTDGGVTWDPPLTDPALDLHGNTSQDSREPKIAAIDTNVYVVWRDFLNDASGDIVAKASSDNGASFDSVENISGTNGVFSGQVVVAGSGNNAFVAWKEGAGSDILFKIGTIGGPAITFDKSQYRDSEGATITIKDATSNTNPGAIETIDATIFSDSDPTGITVTLTEDGVNEETFTGSLTFTTGDSDGASDILKVKAGDLVTATFGGNGGTTSIFQRTVEFSPNGITSYDLGQFAHVKVTDQNSNLDPGTAENISVTLTSNTEEITIVLFETGVDTGIFGGGEKATEETFNGSNVIFTEENDLVTSSGSLGITQTSVDSNLDANAPDTLVVRIKSTTDPTGINLTLKETGDDTDIFVGTILFGFASTPDFQIAVANGDYVTVIIGSLKSHYLITPNPTPANGAIQVTVTGSDGGTITASYKGVSASADIIDGFAPGGGGGGLVRPGLVVNVLAGASALGGGGGGPPGPTLTLGALAKYDSASETISLPQGIRYAINNYDSYTILESITDIYEDFDLPLSINGNGFALGGYENTLERQTIQPGESTEFKIVFYTNYEIAHTSLYFNLGPTRVIAGSDTQVLLYKDKPVEIIDPNGNIASATGSINNEGDLKRVVTFSITFSEDIQWSNSDLVIRAWNDDLNSGDTIVYDAIKVLPSEEEIAFEESLPEPEFVQLKSQYVPIWIKNNAGWWSQELIEDSDFVAGIEYLIQQEIITLTDTTTLETSSVDAIPKWIKNNAGWWTENLISEQEFIDSIQWLISNGIIGVIAT